MALRFITVILGAKCPSGKIATLVLILLGLALCRPAHAQCANAGGLYTVTPSQGQAVCIWPTGTGPYGDFPLMPALEIVESDDNDSDCFDYSLTVSFNQANVSNSTYPQSTYGYYESGDLGANDPWIVDWSNNLEPVSGPNTMYEGGIAQVNYEINGDDNGDQGPAFWIAGMNPSLGSSGAVAAMERYFGAPWWYGHVLTQESSNQQFRYGSDAAGLLSGDFYGAPVFGPPDGFGIAQVDASSGANTLSDGDFWDWTQNLFDGINIANDALSPAQTYLQTQINNMNKSVALEGIGPVYPNAFSAGACSFSYPGGGNGAYYNGEWITEYNGGHFATWNGSSWSYRTTYLSNVCSQPSQTI